MYEPSTWQSMEDFERDLLLFAEYNVPTPEEASKVIEAKNVPDTILRYNMQMAKNKQSPLNCDIDDGLTYVVCGRGRGIKDRVLRPGEPLASDPLDEMELKKKIRQVSGLGYSNELIESAMESNHGEPGDNNTASGFELVPSGSLSSSSSSNSRCTTPKSKKSKASEEANAN